jgi:lipopolysaccharide transport system permease protein
MTTLATREVSSLPPAPREVIEIRPSKGLLRLDFGAVWKYRELLYFLVWRELKIRYKQAALGAAWAVVQPVLALAIFTVIFGMFARIPSNGVPYPVFAFAALLPWTYFSEAFRRASVGLLDDSELIRKIYFPRLVLPLSAVIAPLVDFAISFVLLIGMMLYYGIVPTANIVYLPLFMLLAIGLALGMGLWLGPLNVRFRDIKHILPFLLQIWMYACPVVYPITMVPEKWKLLYSLNPMVGVIEGFRWALIGRGEPEYGAIAIGVGFVVVLVITGLAYFNRAEKSFADRI